jgi:hypothetical protein
MQKLGEYSIADRMQLVAGILLSVVFGGYRAEWCS